MPDSLNLGIGITFDSSQLQQFNILLNYFKKMQTELDKIGEPLKKIKQPTIDLNKEFEKLNLTSKQVYKTVETVGRQITQTFDQGHGKIAQVTRDMDGQIIKIRTLDNVHKTLGDTILANTGKMLQWAISGTLVYGTVRSLQSAFQTMIDLEMQGVNIAKVLPNNVKLQPFEEASISLAERYGQSVIKVEEATANWAKQYKNVNDVAIATQASLLAATATDITFEGSVKDLSAILAEWNLKAQDSIHIVDVLNEESNNYRITAQGLADALAKSGSAARSLGLSIEQLAGIATVGIQTLGIEGNQMGTILTRVFARIRGNESAIKAINALGIDAMQPLNILLTELSAKWDLMTDGQKQNLAITIAGTQHWSRFIGIMDNYNTIIEATAKAYNSMNSAQNEVDRVMQTTQKHIMQLNATWQEYIYRNHGVLDVTKNVADMLRNLVIGMGQFNPLVIVTGVTLATMAFKGWFASIVATNTALSATTVAMLSNPWTAVMAGIAAVAGVLMLVGANANRAQEQVLNMQIELAEFNRINEGIINKSRGIIDLANKYEIYQKAIEKAKNSGQDYSKLSDKFKIAQSELAKAIGVSNAELEAMVKKDGGIKAFVQNRLEENAKLINSEREKANAIKNTTKTQLENQLKPMQENLAKFQQDYKMYTERIKKETPGSKDYYRDQTLASLAQSNITDLSGRIKILQDQINEIKLDTYKTTVKDFYNTGTGFGGYGLDTTGDKPLKDSATITEFSLAFLKMIEEAGKKFDENVNKSISDPERKLKVRNMLLSYPEGSGMSSYQMNISSEAWSKLSSEANKLLNIEESLAKIGLKMSDIQSIYDVAKSKADSFMKPFKGTEEEYNVRQQMNQQYDMQLEKINEQINQLQVLSTIFGENSIAAQDLANAEKLRKQIEDQLKDNQDEITKLEKKMLLQQKWTNLVTSAMDTLATSLINLGGVAENVGQVIQIAMKNIDFATGEFNLQGFGIDLLSSFINNILGGLFGGGSSKPEKQRETNYYETFQKMNDVSAAQAKVEELRQKLALWKVIKPSGFNPFLEDYNEAIADLNDAIIRMKKNLGTSIEDIANQLDNAFQANTYMDFLTNWNQNLYQMTRNALVKSFMAASAYQGLYDNLSKIITDAVVDGTLTAEEINAIKNAGNDLAEKMQILYQALGLLDQAFPEVNQSSNGSQTYQAGMSQSLVINNYVNIYGTYFGEDEDGLREFSLIVAREIAREQSRA